jgi:hypothetical protein
VAFNLLLFAFKYFNTILSSRVSFLFLFLLVFVLHIEGKGPRCSDGEFDSCAIYSHVTLLCKGAYTSSISGHISGTKKGEIASGKPANGDIT